MKRLTQRPLKNWQFILILMLLFFFATLAAVWHVSQLQSRLIESTAIKNAHLFSDALTEFRTLYTSEVVNTARQHGLEISHDYATKEGAIPLPATLSMLLGEKIGQHASGSKTSLYSPYPFPWRKGTGGLRDPFKEEAWRFLSQNPDKSFYRFTERDGHQRLRYATADVMRPACIQCHNSHPDTPKSGWKVGDLRGILEVDLPMDRVIAQTQADLEGTIIIFGSLALLGVIGIGSVTSKLRRTSVELQQRVEERTAELAEKAEMLARSNRELDQFAYVTSHDLKAPLRAIANLSQWIEEDIGEQLNDESRQQMVLLRSRVQRMDALIQGILDYSRVGRVAEESETVEVSALLEEIIDSIDPPPGFTVAVAAGMPVIETQRIRLQQVFANLIGNAIKYREQDDGRVDVSVEDIGEFYRFSISDNGPGIAAEHHEKIFGIFQTLQARDKIESTGVGLTLVKKIVEDQGGEISIDSSLGNGAVFHFTWCKEIKKS
ncbi:hypothetical protein MNBD_GAMMA17-586 [hydrothermal vent metagenome]|uniref:histidine kinase n=1 Tax=hydrothermal vent metagenome TaxID=652676 RepID=A0A3B0Z578_9ZZZZ